MSSLQGLHQLLGGHEVVTDADDVVVAVINEVGEHSVIGASSEHLGILLTSLLSNQVLITRQNAEEHLGVDFLVRVVHVVEATILSPITVSVVSRVSEDLTRPRIDLGGQISSVGEVDDVLGLNSSLDQVIIHTARVASDGVVTPTVLGTEHHSILLSQHDRENERYKNVRSSHIIAYKIKEFDVASPVGFFHDDARWNRS